MLSMVDIPAGTIALRDDRLGTRWQVELSAFRLARYPLVMGDVPLTGVSWYDAVALCNQLSSRDGLPPAYEIDREHVTCDWDSPGYRLPTEAEWQYACTAGTPAYRYGPLDDIAWYADNSDGRARSVGLKAPNAWGLHDMLGNVWEWCSDWYDGYKKEKQDDPTGPASGKYKVLRGGAWGSTQSGVEVRQDVIAIDKCGHPKIGLYIRWAEQFGFIHGEWLYELKHD